MLGPLVLAALVSHAPGASASPVQAIAGQQPATTSAQAEEPWPPHGVSRPGGGTTSPRLVKDIKPNYTADAMTAKIQGAILLEAVVKTDGTVGQVRIVRPLDKKYGLDDEAVKSLKQWQFKPGLKDGVAVPVLVEVEMTFSLRK